MNVSNRAWQSVPDGCDSEWLDEYSRWFCDEFWRVDSHTTTLKWCKLWTSAQPACRRSAVQVTTSAAGGIVTWCLIASAPVGQSELHYSVRAGVCWCWMIGRYGKWFAHGNCTIAPLLTCVCQKSDADQSQLTDFINAVVNFPYANASCTTSLFLGSSQITFLWSLEILIF